MRNCLRNLTFLLILGFIMAWTMHLPATDRLSDHLDETIEDAREEAAEEYRLFPEWDIDLSAGYSLSRGNTDSEDFLARASAIRKFSDIWRLTTRGEYARGEVKDRETREYEKTADRGRLSGQGDYFIIEHGFVYSLTEISYDKMRDLDRRFETGAGFGYDFYRREYASATVEAGAAFIESKYYVDQDEDETERRQSDYYLRFAQNGNFRINERVSLLESVEYKPQIDEFSNYILNAEISLKVNLRRNLYFMVSCINSYESRPPRDLKRNDVRVISSLGITL